MWCCWHWSNRSVGLHEPLETIPADESRRSQITQEWAKEIGDEGNLKMFQRTPNLACPMNQIFLTEEEQTKDKERYPELFEQRWQNYNGFLYQYRPELMFDSTEEERLKMFDMLWNMVSLACSELSQFFC